MSLDFRLLAFLYKIQIKIMLKLTVVVFVLIAPLLPLVFMLFGYGRNIKYILPDRLELILGAIFLCCNQFSSLFYIAAYVLSLQPVNINGGRIFI